MRPTLSTLRENGIKKAQRGNQEQNKLKRGFGTRLLCVSEPDKLSVSIPVSVPSTNIFIFSRNPEFKLSFVRFYISFPPAAQKLPPPFLFISWSIQPLWAGTLLYTPGRFSWGWSWCVHWTLFNCSYTHPNGFGKYWDKQMFSVTPFEKIIPHY